MYFAAHSKLSDEDTKSLSPYLSDDAIVVGASRGKEFNWISRLAAVTRSGCGALGDRSQGGVKLSEHRSKIFVGNRTPYETLLQMLPETERQGWTRVTFDKDCGELHAAGLHDEQAWCEAAFGFDGSPEEPRTVYIVNVLGSKNYFGYFNVYWERNENRVKTKDPYHLKGCHDLRAWTSSYLPKMFAEHNVERWVFLCKEDLDAFERAAGAYRRVFALMEFPFEVFLAGGRPRQSLTVGGAPDDAVGARNSGGTFRRALGIFGFGNSNSWTSGDQALVKRLVSVFASATKQPIDLKEAPASLTKLKAVLLKRLTLTEAPSDAPTRDEIIKLYLELARFFPSWEKLDCSNVFLRKYNNALEATEALVNCIGEGEAEKQIRQTKLQLASELTAHGIATDVI